ncbi:MAG: hypothetical protein ABIQ43_00435 [Sphingomonas sp.]
MNAKSLPASAGATAFDPLASIEIEEVEMPKVYEAAPYEFVHDPELVVIILGDLAVRGSMPIHEIIDRCRLIGFDGRAVAMEVGILLMDRLLRPTPGTRLVDRQTIVELI